LLFQLVYVFVSAVARVRGTVLSGFQSYGAVRGWMAGVHFPAGAMMGFLLVTTASRPTLGPTQPPIQRVPLALTPGVKRSELEAGHSPPSSVEFKNAWSYTSTSK